MNINELYLKTIFCCMACDGDIAEEEIKLVSNVFSQQTIFYGIDIDAVMNGYIMSINANGSLFLKEYLSELSAQNLSEDEQLSIINFAIQTILADNKIEYSEVKFFKIIRSLLSVSDDNILAQHPDIEDFLLPDIKVSEIPEWDNIVFDTIKFSNNEQK